MKKKKVKVMKVVPYQKCPVCNGTGRLFNEFLDPFIPNMSLGYEACHVCKGKGIIPMYELPTPLNLQKSEQ